MRCGIYRSVFGFKALTAERIVEQEQQQIELLTAAAAKWELAGQPDAREPES